MKILTVSRLGLPTKLRRSPACTNIIEKYDGHRASRHPQCEALELVLNRFALDRCGHERKQRKAFASSKRTSNFLPDSERGQVSLGKHRRSYVHAVTKTVIKLRAVSIKTFE